MIPPSLAPSLFQYVLVGPLIASHNELCCPSHLYQLSCPSFRSCPFSQPAEFHFRLLIPCSSSWCWVATVPSNVSRGFASVWRGGAGRRRKQVSSLPGLSTRQLHHLGSPPPARKSSREAAAACCKACVPIGVCRRRPAGLRYVLLHLSILPLIMTDNLTGWTLYQCCQFLYFTLQLMLLQVLLESSCENMEQLGYVEVSR